MKQRLGLILYILLAHQVHASEPQTMSVIAHAQYCTAQNQAAEPTTTRAISKAITAHIDCLKAVWVKAAIAPYQDEPPAQQQAIKAWAESAVESFASAHYNMQNVCGKWAELHQQQARHACGSLHHATTLGSLEDHLKTAILSADAGGETPRQALIEALDMTKKNQTD